MDIVFTEEKIVRITMKGQIKKRFEGFNIEEITKGANTPEKGKLFEIGEHTIPLDETKNEGFRHIVAKLLFLTKRARIDVDLTVSFLCTRVSRSDVNDWEKSRRLLRYLYDTIDLARTIGANGMDILQTWVDASYATHHDMRGHTGGLMSMGIGAIHNKCSKQKLNAKISTETEIIGASYYIPWTLWAKRFLQAQGYILRRNIFYKDKMRAMRLESNGIKSCGEKSRHIDIR